MSAGDGSNQCFGDGVSVALVGGKCEGIMPLRGQKEQVYFLPESKLSKNR